MPVNIFGSGFSAVKTHPRRASSLSSLNREKQLLGTDFSNDFKKINLSVGNHNAVFENGQWIYQTDNKALQVSNNSKDMQKIINEMKQLEEENNLLRIKVELLLDMVTEKSAKLILAEKRLSQL